jgi:mannan endo-1,4-beta-mannosidase
VSATNAVFGDPCVGTVKQLSVQATCGGETGSTTGGTVSPPPPPPPPSGVPRPSWNTGKGFFVTGGKVYDANGVEFRMRGVNHTHWWGGTNEQAIPYISNANANASRAVFGPGGGATTPAQRESIVRQYIAHAIVPVVDYHNATCDESPASVEAAVDLWVGPDKAWLQSLERYVVLNITNEWGPNSTVWRDAYIAAVARLRQAGVKNLLMIDAGGACGQLAESIEAWGNAVFDSDPEKNIVFSVHQYGFWVDPGSPKAGTWDGRQPYDIDAELTRLQATGLALVVGEFSWSAFNQVTYTTRAALAAYEKHGVGWLAWMWNNPGGDATVNMAVTNVYDTSADLTEFGRLLVEDGTLGMKAIARRATIF